MYKRQGIVDAAGDGLFGGSDVRREGGCALRASALLRPNAPPKMFGKLRRGWFGAGDDSTESVAVFMFTSSASVESAGVRVTAGTGGMSVVGVRLDRTRSIRAIRSAVRLTNSAANVCAYLLT